ncbi:cytochrome c1 [Methylophaga nitratireducenticrescens]|uniref:Ubiquinol cytochrome C oxidoreductase, cytochrome C1 subunit n=1 Tax=Methylophaga nitratireducenticrescens TaxID=754476 RepID=I1XGF7_METNJ|nr:cytochrome c1 [Methylophaga nitratireducenticrescens]AFI83476.1 cytochrome c1 [Methylophaga nitratireducenticrescens]AUZ83576.1 cytochrome c1 [Methylophaga nitratireducenticrescens]
MRNLIFAAFVSIFSLFSTLAFAAGPSSKLDKVDIDLTDNASLQRGAHTFVNYCLSCHGASLMRYNRMAKDLGLTDDQVADNLMFTTDKIGDTMKIAMRPEDAKRWFGVMPADLSVIARARGTDWLYTYLRTFYLDDSHPMGTNNLAFKDVGMPHILWEQQGYQTIDEQGHLTVAQEGELTPREYDMMARDLVNFLAYISEPSKLQRLALGKWVLLYLAIFFVIALALKKAYWKDVH